MKAYRKLIKKLIKINKKHDKFVKEFRAKRATLLVEIKIATRRAA